ncbi:lytic murein transglycosylase B [Bermanella sp. R86510]|uniref:lytic murein transglycosylase B n=1 Tax=unclassified Bermanella TaxID=2627862 RepID=UPI0037C61CF8
MRFTVLSASFILMFSSFTVSAEGYQDHPKYEPFIEEMVAEHDYNEQDLRAILSQAEKKESILEAISRPAERTKAWHEYRDIFLTKNRINLGKQFLKDHKQTFDVVEKEYGVPREMIAAIIGVETYYGRIRGSYRVIDALSTLAFDYPQRSLFYRELKNYLLMVRDNDLEATKLMGSYAGAMGLGQFIPSSYISYARDYDGDGIKDIWDNTDDAIASIAYYFKRYHWQPGQPIASEVTISDSKADEFANKTLSLSDDFATWKARGVNVPKDVEDQKAALFRYETEDGMEYWLAYQNFYVITRYNRSRLYARAVYELSQAIK